MASWMGDETVFVGDGPTLMKGSVYWLEVRYSFPGMVVVDIWSEDCDVPGSKTYSKPSEFASDWHLIGQNGLSAPVIPDGLFLGYRVDSSRAAESVRTAQAGHREKTYEDYWSLRSI